MSNVLVAEIIDLVAKAYGVEKSAFLRQAHGVKITPQMREARAVVLMLGLRHTPFGGRSIQEAMGISWSSDQLRRMSEDMERITAGLPSDPQLATLIEGVEQGIDTIHEGRDAIRQSFNRPSRTRRRSSIRPPPLRPVEVDELTERWWAENDYRFRTAILATAE